MVVSCPANSRPVLKPISPDQVADHVLPQVSPLDLGQPQHVRAQVVPGPGGGLGADVHAAEAGGHLVEVVTVLVRHPEQLADDLDGQGQGQQRVQVHRLRGIRVVLGDQLVDQGVDKLLDVVGQPAHAAGGEGGHEQLAHAGLRGLLLVVVDGGAGLEGGVGDL
jgi:hypothetical protein